MTISPSALLGGPRGRHLCLSVASGLHEPVWGAWLQAAWHPSRSDLRSALVATLSGADIGPLRAWSDAESFTGALGDSVNRAMYWQPPDEQDVIAAMPDVVEALQPIAEAIADAPAAQWWTTAIDLPRQRYTSTHEPDEAPDPPDTDPAAPKLAAWKQHTIDDDHEAHRRRPVDPTASYSGDWWSTPTSSGLLRTTRALPASGSVELLWHEDDLGQDRATLWATISTSRPRVYEIDHPEAWTDLVRRYPLDVSWSRRHDWFRVTGRVGTWLIPDWDAVSRDYDAVHLTVLAYLTSATRSLAIDDATATIIAGFSPDETFWLTDALTISEATPERWTKIDGSGTSDVLWARTDLPDLAWVPFRLNSQDGTDGHLQPGDA